jgi:hypothetical protein
VDVKERHEDSDDEAFVRVIGIAQGITDRVRPAFDFNYRIGGLDGFLVNDDAIGRSKEITEIGVSRSDGIAKEVVLGYPSY